MDQTFSTAPVTESVVTTVNDLQDGDFLASFGSDGHQVGVFVSLVTNPGVVRVLYFHDGVKVTLPGVTNVVVSNR